MKNAIIYVHGKGVMQKKLIAINIFLMTVLKSLNPWDAKIEFINYLRNNNNNKYFKKWVC